MADILNQHMEELMNKGDLEHACPLIEELYLSSPHDFKSNLYYGQCAIKKGDTDLAMMVLDRAEILEDENSSLHKSLGDLYAKLGNAVIAKDQYAEAEHFVSGSVNHLAVQNYQTNKFAVSAQLDGGYDSNVEYIAENSAINDWLGANTYTGKPKADTFTREYLSFTHVYDSDSYASFYYKNQLYIYNKNYNRYAEDDFTQGEILTGPGFAFESFNIWLPVSYTRMMTNYTDFAVLYSFKPQINKLLGNSILLKIDGKYEYQQYLQWTEGNKNVIGAEVGVSKWFGVNLLRASYRYEKSMKQDADSPCIFLEKAVHEAELNYSLKLTNSLNLDIGYLYSRVLYNDTIRIESGEKREDKLEKLSTSLIYKIINPMGVSLQYEHYRNESNYIPSDYGKEVIMVGLYLYY